MSWTEELDVPTQEFVLDKKKPKKAEPSGPEQFVLGVRIGDKDELDIATDRLKFTDVLLEELAAEEQQPITLYPKTPLKKRHPVARMLFLLLLLGLCLAAAWLVRTHGVDLYAFVTSLEKKEAPVKPPPVRAAPKPTPAAKPEKPAEPAEKNPAPAEKPKRTARPHKPRAPAAAPARYGFLQVNSTPWTEVYVDDRDVGFTPVVKFKLTVGEHEVRLINEGYEIDASIVVIIEENETVSVLKKFNK